MDDPAATFLKASLAYLKMRLGFLSDCLIDFGDFAQLGLDCSSSSD
jgi:hypothetical protein